MNRYCLIRRLMSIFKQNFIWNVSWQEIKLLFKVETIRFCGFGPNFRRGLLSRDGTSLWFLMRRIRRDPLPQLQCFRNFLHARNGSKIEANGNLKAQDKCYMLGVVADRFLGGSMRACHAGVPGIIKSNVDLTFYQSTSWPGELCSALEVINEQILDFIKLNFLLG